MSVEIRVSECMFNNCKARTAQFFDPVAGMALPHVAESHGELRRRRSGNGS